MSANKSLEQYVLRLWVALRQLRRWREHDAASRLLLQRTGAVLPPLQRRE
jgi:hypothetical protein